MRSGDIKTFEILENGKNYRTEYAIHSEFSRPADQIRNLPMLLQINELLRIGEKSKAFVTKRILKSELVKQIEIYYKKEKVLDLFEKMIRKKIAEERYKDVMVEWGVARGVTEDGVFIRKVRKEFSDALDSKIKRSSCEFEGGLENLLEMHRRVSKLGEQLEEKSKNLENVRKATEENAENLERRAIGRDLGSSAVAAYGVLENVRKATGEMASLENSVSVLVGIHKNELF
jgi:hypothetical protein